MLFSQDEVKRREYELQEKAIRDYNATMLYNRKEGKQEGKQEEKRESVLRYLKLGISPEIISRGSELSLQEVLNLQKTLSQNWLITYFLSEYTNEEEKVIAMTNTAIKEALNYEMLFFQDEVKRHEYELQEKLYEIIIL